MEVASLYNAPEYLVMTDDEKRKALMPVTDGEMREFIEIRREIDAARRTAPTVASPSKGSEGPFRRLGRARASSAGSTEARSMEAAASRSVIGLPPLGSRTPDG